MKCNKKITVICIFCFVVFALGVYIAYTENDNILPDEILVSNWNGMEDRFYIGHVKKEGDVYTNYSECYTSFRTNTEIMKSAKKNKDYLKDTEFIHGTQSYKSDLFYYNNNYYVLYFDKVSGIYTAQNCCGVYQLSGSRIYFPFLPDYILIDYGFFEVYNSDGLNVLDFIYDNYSYQEAVDYFAPLEKNGLVAIDDINERISIDGYDPYSKENVKKCVALDFKNRTIIGNDEDGKQITITGLETP